MEKSKRFACLGLVALALVSPAFAQAPRQLSFADIFKELRTSTLYSPELTGILQQIVAGLLQGQGPILPHVPNNAALQAIVPSAGEVEVRDGLNTPGDGYQATYVGSTTNCTAPDNQIQVQPTGTGCWIVSPLSVASGGTGTSTPSLIGGTNVTITGTWPNQTISASGGGSGAVSSVTNSDGSLTVSPTTGVVVASLNPNNPTTWGGLQTFATGGLAINGGSATAGIATVSNLGILSSEAIVPVINGGNGTATPSLTAGANISLSGVWPNYTISATGSGGGGSGFLFQTDVLTITATNTLSALSQTYAPGYLELNINGASYICIGGTSACSASGTTVTWNATAAGYSLTTGGAYRVSATYTFGTAIPTSIAINSTPITGGTNGYILGINGSGNVGQTATTGSGNVVLATSPTLVTPALGTPSAVNLTNAIGLPIATGVSGLGTSVAATLALTANGSGGGLVRATSPSIAGLTVTGSLTATGLVTNADLTNSSTTVNGQTCALGSSCTVTSTVAFPATATGGTSGGIPYFSSSTTLASSAALTANAFVLGGGAGAAPTTTATNSSIVSAVANVPNAASGIAVLNVSGFLPGTELSYTQSGTGGTTLSLQSVTAQRAVTPQMFGATCDGSSDDSSYLQNWLNALGTLASSGYTNVAGYLPPGACAFGTALTSPSKNAITIYGDGLSSSLRWTGGATTTPLKFGTTTGACSINSLTLRNFLLTSSVTMTAGSAIELDDTCGTRVTEVAIEDNAGGSDTKWYQGITVKGGNQVYLTNDTITGTNAPIIGYGDSSSFSSTQLTDLRILGGIITGGLIGVDLAGNVGGATIDATDILQNHTDLKISQDLVAIPNLQIFLGPSLFLDHTTGTGGIDLDLEDAGGTNSILQMTGTWLASSTGDCMYVASGASAWNIKWTGGSLVNCTANGIEVQAASVKMNISNINVNMTMGGFGGNTGYGIYCNTADANIKIVNIDFVSVTGSGNYSPNCTPQSFTQGGSATVYSAVPDSNSGSPTTAWQRDVSGQTVTTIANGANVSLPIGSGRILVTNQSNGDTAEYLCGGAYCVLSASTESTWVAPTTAPASGKMSIIYNGTTAYAIYNNYGSSVNVNIALEKTRNAN